LSDNLSGEMRLTKSRKIQLLGLLPMFVLQFGEAIHRSVQEAKTTVRNPSEFTSFCPKGGCLSACGVCPVIFSSAIQTERMDKASVLGLIAGASLIPALRPPFAPGAYRRFLSARGRNEELSFSHARPSRIGTTGSAIDQLLCRARDRVPSHSSPNMSMRTCLGV
jgi:hypothetical protein